MTVTALRLVMSCVSGLVEVIVLHEDTLDSSEDRRVVVDESSLLLHEAEELVLALHGCRPRGEEENREGGRRRGSG